LIISEQTLTGTRGGVPHGGVLVDRRLEAGEAAELEASRLPWLRLGAAEAADLRALASGAYSPLSGFMDAKQHQSVCESMRLPDGTLWPIPVCLGLPEGGGGGWRPGAAWWSRRRAGGRAGGRGGLRARPAAGGRAGLRHHRPRPPGGGAGAGRAPVGGDGAGAGGGGTATRAGGGAGVDPGRDEGRLCRAWLGVGGGVPDPQPGASRPQVPDEVRPGGGRRAAAAPAGGAHQGRRRARRGAPARL
jgi:hypothetical protein